MCIDVDKVIALANDLSASLKDLRELSSAIAERPGSEERFIKHIEETWFNLRDAMKGVECIDRDALIHSIIPYTSEEELAKTIRD